MAIRAENNGVIGFGAAAAEVVATHGRVMKTSVLVVKELVGPVTFAIGDDMEIPSGSIDIVFVAGDTENDGLEEVIEDYWASGILVDLMTDDSTVVADAGYSQQTHDAWTLTQEVD